MRKGYSAAIFGPPKVGKSWLLDTLPKPALVVDAEGSVEYTPSRKILWDPRTGAPPEHDDSWDVCVVRALDYGVLDTVYQWLHSGQHVFRGLGFDHLTEIQKRIIYHFNGTSALREADWGTLLRHMDDWVRKHRDLRLIESNSIEVVAFNAEMEKRDDRWQPKLQGSYRDELPYAVDLIGYMYLQRSDDGVAHRRLLIEPSVEPPIVAGTRLDPIVERFGSVIEIARKNEPESGESLTSILEVLNGN